MKFIIEKNTFLKLLGHANNVVERRNTLLILANILIEAKEDRIRITATDMEMEVIEEAAAQIIEQGQTTVPAAVIFEYVGKLNDGAQIEVETDEENAKLVLKSGKSNFSQPTMPANEFPLMDTEDFTHNFQMDSAKLRDLLHRVRFAMSTEETRYYLNGVYIHALEGDDAAPKLRLVATDGHRMARLEDTLPEGASGIPGIIVPRKTVNDLIRLLEDQEGNIDLSLGATKIRFEIDDLLLTSKLIDGRFPDYDRVIPTDNNIVLDVDQKELRTVLNRVAIVATERTKTVRMKLQSNTAILSSVSNEQGSAEDELLVEFSGQPLTIGFNSKYMGEILSNITSDRAQILMMDESNPFIISDSNDETALYLLMPLRV